MCFHLRHRLQDGLWGVCYITEDVQIGSVHVLSAGQQHRDLQMEVSYVMVL